MSRGKLRFSSRLLDIEIWGMGKICIVCAALWKVGWAQPYLSQIFQSIPISPWTRSTGSKCQSVWKYPSHTWEDSYPIILLPSSWLQHTCPFWFCTRLYWIASHSYSTSKDRHHSGRFCHYWCFGFLCSPWFCCYDPHPHFASHQRGLNLLIHHLGDPSQQAHCQESYTFSSLCSFSWSLWLQHRIPFCKSSKFPCTDRGRLLRTSSPYSSSKGKFYCHPPSFAGQWDHYRGWIPKYCLLTFSFSFYFRILIPALPWVYVVPSLSLSWFG